MRTTGEPREEIKLEEDGVETAVAAYVAARPVHETFSARLADLLRQLLDQNGVRYQTIEHRAKSVSSFREKITRRGKEYETPLKELPDLSGVRIIVYYADDVARIRSVIESEFDLQTPVSGDKLDEMAPNEFGYRSVHCVVALNTDRKKLVEWRQMNDLRAEIQLRTVLQHAWAAISHVIQYKQEAEIPKSLRRRLSRLSGLLELADEQFETIRDEHQKLASHIELSRNTAVAEFTIDRLTLTKYLEEATVAKDVEAAAEAAGFREILKGYDFELGALAWACSRAEISSIAQLDSALRDASDRAERFFTLVAQGDAWPGSLPFFALILIVGLHSDRFSSDLLTAHGWTEYTAERVLAAAAEI